MPEIRDRVLGCSVESVGFVNMIDNITPATSRLLVTYYDGATTQDYVITILPGHYSYTELAEELELAVYDQLFGGAGDVFFTATAVPAEGGQPALIALEFTEVGSYIDIVYDRNTLAFPLGLGDASTRLSTATGPVLNRPNLYGPIAVLLSTRALSGSRSSVNGNGEATPTLMSVPLSVPYGSIQTMHMGAETRPVVQYSHGAHRNLSNIDVSLRHLDGSLVDLGTAEMYVSFRVWLKHV
jgi:hypothetical protein